MTPPAPDYDLPTLAARLAALGYGAPGNDLDQTLHWVLTELEIRRAMPRFRELSPLPVFIPLRICLDT